MINDKIRTRILNRNALFVAIRAFFAQRDVLEVDTSLLRKYSVTDPYMDAFSVLSPLGKHQGYLQTSPEYAMKKLLSEGAGDIYQLSKMFRAEENGQIHSCEFTMLEWYRMGFDHHQLMQEVCHLIRHIVGDRAIKIMTFQNVFEVILDINPFSITIDELRSFAMGVLGDIPQDLLFDNYLTLLFSEKIETSFDPEVITVVHGYPKSQASLAKIELNGDFVTAARFEVYLGGVELANGFNELTNANEQLERFHQDNEIRRILRKKTIDIDQGFIRAMNEGLPACSGVALGVDRLLMIKHNKQHIDDVLLG